MSDSVWPHGQQPTRLHCPWDSPGKNNGVSCHFLLQCMKVKRESEVAYACLTLATPWTAAPQASLSIINSQNLPKPTSIELVMPSNHHPLSSSSSALNLSQHQGFFKWVSSSHQVAKVLEFQLQHQSFQWTPRTDLL